MFWQRRENFFPLKFPKSLLCQVIFSKIKLTLYSPVHMYAFFTLAQMWSTPWCTHHEWAWSHSSFPHSKWAWTSVRNGAGEGNLIAFSAHSSVWHSFIRWRWEWSALQAVQTSPVEPELYEGAFCVPDCSSAFMQHKYGLLWKGIVLPSPLSWPCDSPSFMQPPDLWIDPWSSWKKTTLCAGVLRRRQWE